MDNQLFTPVKTKTLRAHIVDTLRDAIVSGKLQPGAHLKETVIATQMGVSRSPIREAFQQLEQEGLIESAPHQGSFVRTIEADDVREIFTLRATLEALACRLIVKNARLQAEDVVYLENLIAKQERAVAARDLQTLLVLDMAFHRTLCRLSGMRRLFTMWQSLEAQMQVLFYRRYQARPDHVPQSVGVDHQAILNALREGDAATAVALTETISTRVTEDCLQILETTVT